MRITILLLVILPLCLNHAHATRFRINNTEGINANFTTIQEAHNEAVAGDTLYIEGSLNTYDGTTTIKIEKQLVLIGPGYFLGENPFTQADKLSAKVTRIDFAKGAEKSVILGLSVTNLHILTIDVTVRRNHIRNLYLRTLDCLILQNYIENTLDAIASRGIISNNIIQYATLDQTSSFRVFNNVFFYPQAGYGISAYNSEIRSNIIYGGSTREISRNNEFTNNIFRLAGDTSNGNLFNVDMSTVFVGTSADGKYTLSENSPAKGAGLNGIDSGVFGGTDPYVLSGIPPGPSIYELSAPATVPKGTGLPVTLKVKSNN